MPVELVEEAEGFQQSGEEVYAENMPIVRVFLDIFTQWRVGPGGLIGLDYNVLFRRLDRLFQDEEEWEDVYAGVKIMESAALETLREDD